MNVEHVDVFDLDVQVEPAPVAEEAAGAVVTDALQCVQSVLIYCFTIQGNCGN
ncbi:FDLD family class I lanthipeptide [Streptomyces sp. NPDC003032]